MNGRLQRWRSGLLGLALLLAVAAPASAGRVVAVGDIHGDLEAFRGILLEAGLLGGDGRWIAGDTTLVQTGDFLDRGPAFREMMDYLQDLQKAARRAGGNVIVLLGNHEVMNLLGDLRYVTPENYAGFADGRSENRRAAAWSKCVKQQQARAVRLGLPEPRITEASQARWMEEHPPGFVEQRAALGRDGSYGRWLRGLPVIARVGDSVFLHGGVGPALAGRSVTQIRDRVKEELILFERYRGYLIEENVVPPTATLSEMIQAARQELELLAPAEGERARERTRHEAALEEFLASESWYLRHSSGPLWFRGLAEWSDEEIAAELPGILAGLGVRRMAVGHTPTSDRRIHSRVDGALFLIDTGMLSSHYEGGRASALEIAGDTVTALYVGERTRLVPAAPPVEAPGAQARGGQSEPLESSLAPAPGLQGGDPAGSGGTADRGRWLDPDGEWLPFRTDEEVLEFLRTAKVVFERIIKAGINQPTKVTLAKDGITMHAVFRDVDVQEDVVHLGGKREMFFRDSYYFEPAAYEIARMLDLDTVPPVVLRKIGRTHGSLQIWVEEAMTEEKRQEEGRNPPDVTVWNRQMQRMHIFDALVYNTDRNRGNILIDRDWKLWMIDHTRAFRHHKKLPDAPGFAQCDRKLYRMLQELDPEEVRTRLKPLLRKNEIQGLLARRDALIEYIDGLARDHGEDAVFFDFDSGSRR